MQKLIDYLQGIADGAAKVNKSLGLCSHVASLYPEYSEIFDNAMRQVCKTWKHYSGDNLFPIYMPRFINPANAFIKADKHGTMYKGEYGRRRRELAGLIAEELRKCKS